MEVTIIGWYGTETIGDRAILAGLIHAMSEVFPNFRVRIGSLYPFFTERTLSEDMDFYKHISLNRLQSVSVFDSRNPYELKKNIRQTHVLMVGGGPLMDLAEMSMLEYAFVQAKKNHVKTLLMGCGWGPLKDENTIQRAIRLVEMSDYTIFRDQISLEQYQRYGQAKNVSASIDPAFFACHYYVGHVEQPRRESHIAINFRDVALEGTHYAEKRISDTLFSDMVKEVASQTNLPIYLVPMHYFSIGGDDRMILQKIQHDVNLPQVQTIHSPLSLFETMEMYYHAKVCIGMRFHAIVLQTMLNGNNYIVDYTDVNTGKISGMMKQMQLTEYYRQRYFSLYDNKKQHLTIDLNHPESFQYDARVIEQNKEIYLQVLRQ
jgi:polysaccharide pyruvyl transferase WcaK-like protein